MKKKPLRRVFLLLALSLVFVMMLAGCTQSNGTGSETTSNAAPSANSASPNAGSGNADNSGGSAASSELYVRFGDDGAPFTMHLYDNDTAAAIARHVGTAEWRLPIYHYDDYDHWQVMQYYDIPNRYDIPSNPESVTTEKAGTVYYSEPNRIVLFFGEAAVSGEYTPVGYFDVTDAFVSAVRNNPVLEGWGNKIVHISDEE